MRPVNLYRVLAYLNLSNISVSIVLRKHFFKFFLKKITSILIVLVGNYLIIILPEKVNYFINTIYDVTRIRGRNKIHHFVKKRISGRINWKILHFNCFHCTKLNFHLKLQVIGFNYYDNRFGCHGTLTITIWTLS